MTDFIHILVLYNTIFLYTAIVLTAVLEVRYFTLFLTGSMRQSRIAPGVFTALALILLYLVVSEVVNSPASVLGQIVIELFILTVCGMLLSKKRFFPSLSAAFLVITIPRLVNGIFNAISFLTMGLLYPAAEPSLAEFVCLIIINVSSLLSLYLTFRLAARFFRPSPRDSDFPGFSRMDSNRYLPILIFPVLLIFLVDYLIAGTIYGYQLVIDPQIGIISPQVNSWQMLLIQLAAYLCLFAVLYAYRGLSDSQAEQTRSVLLEQQLSTQREYLQEITQREAQSRSLRHDLKNHFLVLSGLLENGELENARAYLGKLAAVSDQRVVICETGCETVDVLLSEKLSLAKQNGVMVQCNVNIPTDCGIDELDLCTVFANAMDNANKACSAILSGEDRYIRLSGFTRGSFFMIEVENSRSPDGDYPSGAGIGLSNIRTAAEKYDGTVSVEQGADFFKLNVLFLISPQAERI